MLALVLPVVLIAAVVAGALYFRGRPGGIAGVFGGSSISADRELTGVVEATFESTYQPAEGVGSFDERWWTEKHLVRMMPNQLVAYDLASGKVAWQVDVPPNHYCRASAQQSAKGYVALFGGTRDDACRKLTVVDVNNGKVVWSKDLPPADPSHASKPLATDFPRFDHRPAVLGERVYVPTDNGGHIFSLADGSVVQQPNPKSECYSTHYDVIGSVGVAYRNCSRSGDKGRHLSGFDQAGKVIWRWNLPEERGKAYKVVGVLSTDPLLVMVFGERREKQIWRVEPGGPDGVGKHTVVADISDPRAKDSVSSDPCEITAGDGLYDCSRQVVSKDVLYLQHRKRDQSSDVRYGIAAYNTETGKQVWFTEWDAAHDITEPVGLDDGGRPIAYLLPTEADPAALLSVDPTNGKLTPIATMPPPNKAMARLGKPGMTESPEAGTVDWRNGYLAFLKTDARQQEAGYGATIVYK